MQTDDKLRPETFTLIDIKFVRSKRTDRTNFWFSIGTNSTTKLEVNPYNENDSFLLRVRTPWDELSTTRITSGCDSTNGQGH